MHPAYSDWLRRAVPSESTWRTKLSELRRIEAAYGDLDGLYDQDELQSLLGELSYSTEDTRLGRENPSRLEIAGDIRNNLASYSSALRKYIRFRNEVEIEAGHAVLATSPPDEPPETDARLSLERDLQAALRRSITQLEPGLSIIDGGAERQVPSGRIDILAQDTSGCRVVIELKAVRAPRDAVAQVLAYMGDLSADGAAEVRGLLIAPDFDPRAIAAARMVPALRLIRFSFSFQFDRVGTGP
jgi:hypothetical protein